MPHSLTLNILQNHYRVVLCLRDYLSQICGPQLVLEEQSDTESYRSLVKTSYVALLEPHDVSRKATFGTGQVMSEMYEVIDRAQIRLFEQAKGKPLNVLTAGYRRADRRGEHGRADMSRQGITNYFPNTNITALQALEWKLVLTRIGEGAMCHLLSETSIFVALPNDSLCQLVGTPITELKPHTLGFLSGEATGVGDSFKPRPAKRQMDEDRRPTKRRRVEKTNLATLPPDSAPDANMKQLNVKLNSSRRSATDIIFPRVRILYARPMMSKDVQSGRRCIAVGLPSTHTLQRLAPVKLLANGDVPSRDNIAGRDARHVLKHIFPRQFGLMHPFDANQHQSIGGFKFDDYAAREQELQMKGNVKTPKRLKPVLDLVHQLIKRHWACNYRVIRSKFCPSKLKKLRMKKRQPLDSVAILEIMSEEGSQNQGILTQVPTVNVSGDNSLIFKHGASMAEREAKNKPRFTEYTCSHYEVFQYMLNVTKAVIPKAFWGCQKNFKIIMKHVEQFIKGRKFESITLHSLLQGFSTQECDWLLPENNAARHQRPPVTDALKRRELVEEFLYWYFNSFVIPVLRTSFYATESAAFRQRVLYFRQDDWAALCRPLVDQLTEGTFEKLDRDDALEILRQRKLGFSFVRLLPKETSVRPIVNLRRKCSQGQPDGSLALSINQVLQAAFQILTYEKEKQGHLLGASVFGHNQIYAKLKSFKTRLVEKYNSIPKLYFVKVDVRTCFDSIEQNKLLGILQHILSEDGYMIQRYSQLLPMAGKVQRMYPRTACPEVEHPYFLTYAAKLAGMLRHAIFVDQVVYPYADREEIYQLLKEHVTENIVKIGQNYYRQTVGIPQGSVLSTILCSFFYGDLETKVFKFTEDDESMLCRLVDDYLFVSTDISKARKFLAMMTAGHPEYGCFISAEKTLINFDVKDYVVNQIYPGQRDFPWCGLLIDMNNLSISADYTRYRRCHIGDTLTIERCRRPGAVFEHRMLQMARLKCHAIFCDTSLNSEKVVYRNIYQGFLLSAMKMYCYIRGWGIDLSKKSVTTFILKVIHKMIRFSYTAARSKTTGQIGRTYGATCTINQLPIIWLGTHAFWTVLKRKGNAHLSSVTMTLESELGAAKFAKCRKRWAGMVKEAREMVEGMSY